MKSKRGGGSKPPKLKLVTDHTNFPYGRKGDGRGLKGRKR